MSGAQNVKQLLAISMLQKNLSRHPPDDADEHSEKHQRSRREGKHAYFVINDLYYLRGMLSMNFIFNDCGLRGE